MEMFLTNIEGIVVLAVLGGVILALLYFQFRKTDANKKSTERKVVGSAPEARSESNQTPIAMPKSEEPSKSSESSELAPLDWNASKTVSEALAQTEKSFWGRIQNLFSGTSVSPEIEIIEEVLYTSDLGPKTVSTVMESLDELSGSEKGSAQSVKGAIRGALANIFSKTSGDEKSFHEFKVDSPMVLMVVGVNGAGKTTSIGKLSAHFTRMNKKVMVVAGDTFRAAAGAQLKVWTERAGVEVFSPAGITDPSAVAFDGLTKAKNQNFDVVIIDTAGRLHTSAPLMDELKKMKRVMQKVIPTAPHETIIVLDANSGQNAMVQAREFHAALGLTGVMLTKLDGTAKGGVAFGIVHELGIPIRWIGIGEKLGDLKPFNSAEFIDAVLK